MSRKRVHSDTCPPVKAEAPDYNESGELVARDIAAETLRPSDDGNLLSSIPANFVRAAQGYHLPIFDIDVPHTLVPSQTPGHSHLYIHKYVHRRPLHRIMLAMRDGGLCGAGNIAQFNGHGMQLARVPTEELVRELQLRKPEAPHELDYVPGAF